MTGIVALAKLVHMIFQINSIFENALTRVLKVLIELAIASDWIFCGVSRNDSNFNDFLDAEASLAMEVQSV